MDKCVSEIGVSKFLNQLAEATSLHHTQAVFDEADCMLAKDLPSCSLDSWISGNCAGRPPSWQGEGTFL